jgi:ketosteroid isomerase-like protein
MSQENVEVVKEMNAALNRGDIDDAMARYAPDAELRDLANGPDQPTLVRGTDQIREVWALWTAAFDELHADVEEFFDAGEAVVCASHWIGRGKTSGMSIDGRQFDVFECRDGKVIRAVFGCKSKAEALEAVGRREQDTRAHT